MTSAEPASAPRTSPRLDARLVCWLASQVVLGARSRLIEGGADADARVEQAAVYVDLSVAIEGRSEASVTRALCGMASNVDDKDEPRVRWLLVGGPGSGKSTATTIASQLMRLPWIERQLDDLPTGLRAAFEEVAPGLRNLATSLKIEVREEAVPVRVNLPSLARWLALSSDGEGDALWRYLASRGADDGASLGQAIDVTAATLRSALRHVGRVFWFFDGLDEVPRSAGRDAVVAVVQSVVVDPEIRAAGLVVTTRPQGYEGEFDALQGADLCPLHWFQASGYGERLLRAWFGSGSELEERVQAWRDELNREEVQDLVTTPLHATMAALLVARGSLPHARARCCSNTTSTRSFVASSPSPPATRSRTSCEGFSSTSTRASVSCCMCAHHADALCETRVVARVKFWAACDVAPLRVATRPTPSFQFCSAPPSRKGLDSVRFRASKRRMGGVSRRRDGDVVGRRAEARRGRVGAPRNRPRRESARIPRRATRRTTTPRRSGRRASARRPTRRSPPEPGRFRASVGSAGRRRVPVALPLDARRVPVALPLDARRVPVALPLDARRRPRRASARRPTRPRRAAWKLRPCDASTRENEPNPNPCATGGRTKLERGRRARGNAEWGHVARRPKLDAGEQPHTTKCVGMVCAGTGRTLDSIASIFDRSADTMARYLRGLAREGCVICDGSLWRVASKT